MTVDVDAAVIGRWSKRGSYLLAAVPLGFVALSFVPVELSFFGAGDVLASLFPSDSTPALLLPVCYTLALASTVVVRGLTTKRTADLVLAAFTMPCILVSVIGLVQIYTTLGGGGCSETAGCLDWSGVWGVVVLLTGVFLAVVVLADAFLARWLRSHERPIDG